MLPIFNMGVIAGAGFPNLSLLAAIQGLGLSTNLKLCLDAGDRDSYSGGSLTTVAGPSTLTTQGASFNNFTIRQVIAASAISASGSQVVVAFQGDGAGTFTCSKAYIGEQAAAGDSYDFAAAPTQLTFGGNAGFTITGGNIIASDPLTFTLDETKSYVIAWLCPSSSTDDFGRQVTLSGWSGFFKSGDDVTTVNATGYTTSDNVMGVYSLSVVASGDGGQVWADRSSSATDFVRGLVGIADSADPTFNGNVGGLSVSDYWSFDGTADYFAPAALANPSWVQPFHKDNATFTVMWGFRGNDTATVIGNALTTVNDIGFFVQIAGTSIFFQAGNGVGGGANKTSSALLSTSAPSIGGISVNEAGGASGGVFFGNGTSETFNATYTSPSASSADHTLAIGTDYVGSTFSLFSSTSRLYWIAVWDIALTAQNMTDIYSAMRGRFNI
jgi:hypothetical protein